MIIRLIAFCSRLMHQSVTSTVSHDYMASIDERTCRAVVRRMKGLVVGDRNTQVSVVLVQHDEPGLTDDPIDPVHLQHQHRQFAASEGFSNGLSPLSAITRNLTVLYSNHQSSIVVILVAGENKYHETSAIRYQKFCLREPISANL